MKIDKQDFIAFLEKTPNQKYHFAKPATCAVARYLRAKGETHVRLSSEEVANAFDEIQWSPWMLTLCGSATFGELARRLRAN